METVTIELKAQMRSNSLMKNMFNFLVSKKIDSKFIDLTPPKEDDPNHIPTFIIQGKMTDRFNNEFLFQIHLDKDRLKLDTAQPQVTLHFQHLTNQTIKLDVDTNGQLVSALQQYIYLSKSETFKTYKSKKESEIETPVV